MPEFYSKSFQFRPGLTYAIGGGNPGYTSSLFPTGACYMDGVNALIANNLGGATLTMVLAGATLPMTVNILSGVIYPFRPRIIGFTGNAGLVGLL